MAAARLAYAPESPAHRDDLRLLLVEYVDLRTGRGWYGGGWSVVFPADVLRDHPWGNGWFLVRGQRQGREFVVEEVLRRAPITAPDGAVLVTSWPDGATAPVRRWERR